MKLFSRDFTTKEKVLLLVLAIILVALVYYQFVHVPVTEALDEAKNREEALEVELEAVQLRIAKLEKMQKEIDEVYANGTLKSMPSYNNSHNVNKLLNDVLGDMGYNITFSNVTRNGDQIRRNIYLQFTAPDYESVRTLLSQLTGSDYRCLVGDFRCTSEKGSLEEGTVTVSVTITFFETMVGGTADYGLPSEKTEK
ncbi:MAG: type II secretion system protein M [Clostridia bacterium]|nr:type II secretion system protein M [Clostridia bacterium]